MKGITVRDRNRPYQSRKNVLTKEVEANGGE